MSKITIRIPMPLRPCTGATDEIPVKAATVRDALTALGAAHDGILTRVLSREGELRQFVNVFVEALNAGRSTGRRRLIVALPNDTGERYPSTGMWQR